MSHRRSLWSLVGPQLPSPLGLLPLVAALLIWEMVQRGASPYFPRPSLWWTGLVDLGRAGTLQDALAATLSTLMVGLAVAIAVGVLLGLLIGLSPWASRALSPLLEFLRAVPPPAVVPLVILLLGYDDSMKVFVVAFSALWPVLLNVALSVERIHPRLFEVSRTFHLGSLRRFTSVVLPSVLPGLFVGIRVALPLAIIVTLLVEILTSIGGLGALMIAAQRNFRSGQVYGLLVLIGAIGFALNCLLIALEAIALRNWPPRDGAAG